MTDIDSAEVQRLLQEGRAAALAGDNIAARGAFRRASELDATSVDAWIGLSSAVPILSEKLGYLQRALAIDPAHAEARMSLEYVEKLIADGLQIAPSQRVSERRATGDSSPLLAAPEREDAPTTETLFCYIHPDRETGLRCVQCTRPICGQCAKPAAVGQLCPECRKERRPANYKVAPTDVIVVGLVAAGVAAPIAGLLTIVPGFGIYLSLIVGWFGGILVVRAIDRVTRAKRGRMVQIAAPIGVILGAIVGAMLVMGIRLMMSAEVAQYLAENPAGFGELIGLVIGGAIGNFSQLLFMVVASIVVVRQLR